MMKKTILFVTLFAMTLPLLALDYKVLVLPPFTEEVVSQETQFRSWQRLLEIYSSILLNTEVVEPNQLINHWQGEIHSFDLQMIDEAIALGNELEVDRVILCDWNGNQEGESSILTIDIWENVVSDISTASGLEKSVRQAEKDRWIYGISSIDQSRRFDEPEFTGGKKAIHKYLHHHRSYPSDAVIHGVSCNAEVSVVVSNLGIPLKVTVLSVSQKGWGFEDAIEQALWGVEYQPGEYNGQPVTSFMRKSIRMAPLP